ncbi:MAG: DUF697 domain-containing protein [Candidatus Solibacter sp.]|nr:DUF697 domain-containing protein [Candidatus Solibacter sp.]
MVDEDKVNSTILRYSLLAGVADITPIVGADLAGVLGCQLTMYYTLAEHYGVEVTKERFKDLVLTLVGAVGGWSATIFGATAMIKSFPGVSSLFLYWQPPVVAAFTWAMGQVLKSYLPSIRDGAGLEKADLRLAMKEAWHTARHMNWRKDLAGAIRPEREAGPGPVEARAMGEGQAADAADQPIEVLPYEQRKLIVIVDDSTKTITKQLPIDVLLVPRGRARNLCIPGTGQPEANFPYIAHPYKPLVYYPAPKFHDCLFDDKAREILKILVYLGAAHVTLDVQKGYGWKAKIGTEAGLRRVPVGLKIGAGKSSSKRLYFNGKYSPTQAPQLPPDTVWYEHEPIWRDIAEQRLRQGLEQFELKVEYNDDFGIDAELLAGLGKLLKIAGVRLSGAYTKFKSTIWLVEVEFGHHLESLGAA